VLDDRNVGVLLERAADPFLLPRVVHLAGRVTGKPFGQCRTD
jgi:hypothetical protein